MPLACDAKAEQRALLRASLCVEANQLRALQHVRCGARNAAADALAAEQVLRPQMLQHLAQKEAVQKVQPAAGAGRRSSGRRSNISAFSDCADVGINFSCLGQRHFWRYWRAAAASATTAATTAANAAADAARVAPIWQCMEPASARGCQLDRRSAAKLGEGRLFLARLGTVSIVLLDDFVDEQEAEQLLQHAGHTVCAAPALVRSSIPARVLEHVQADPAAAVREEHVGVAVEEICHQPNGWRGYGVVRRELEVQVHHHALPAAVRRDHVGAPLQRVVGLRLGRDVAEPRL
mmetsp:Transcript_5070/g.15383  ORF Transcript_5070/g.15383 Transcript_5070/m.15383 type:complete len:292 (-) Transcript_5070:210-1085(-)